MTTTSPPVGPHTDGRTLCVAVTLQLFDAVLPLGFLDLDDDVGCFGIVGVHHHDISPLLAHSRAKEDRLLHLNAIRRIAIIVYQLLDVQLPHDFFRIGAAIPPRRQALEVGMTALLKEPAFQPGNGVAVKDGQFVLIGFRLQNISDTINGFSHFALSPCLVKSPSVPTQQPPLPPPLLGC